MQAFSVTYEIVTPESAENGDAEERGFIAEAVTLSEAVRCLFETRTVELAGATGIEANEWPVTAPRWVTVYNSAEYRTGACENRSIHFPENMTAARRRHLARVLGVN